MKDDNDVGDHNRERIKEQLVFFKDEFDMTGGTFGLSWIWKPDRLSPHGEENVSHSGCKSERTRVCAYFGPFLHALHLLRGHHNLHTHRQPKRHIHRDFPGKSFRRYAINCQPLMINGTDFPHEKMLLSVVNGADCSISWMLRWWLKRPWADVTSQSRSGGKISPSSDEHERLLPSSLQLLLLLKEKPFRREKKRLFARHVRPVSPFVPFKRDSKKALQSHF